MTTKSRLRILRISSLLLLLPFLALLLDWFSDFDLDKLGFNEDGFISFAFLGYFTSYILFKFSVGLKFRGDLQPRKRELILLLLFTIITIILIVFSLMFLLLALMMSGFEL